jgi:hypothetical protein
MELAVASAYSSSPHLLHPAGRALHLGSFDYSPATDPRAIRSAAMPTVHELCQSEYDESAVPFSLCSNALA